MVASGLHNQSVHLKGQKKYCSCWLEVKAHIVQPVVHQYTNYEILLPLILNSTPVLRLWPALLCLYWDSCTLHSVVVHVYSQDDWLLKYGNLRYTSLYNYSKTATQLPMLLTHTIGSSCLGREEGYEEWSASEKEGISAATQKITEGTKGHEFEICESCKNNITFMR